MVEWGKKTQKQRTSITLKEATIKQYSDVKETKNGMNYITAVIEAKIPVGIFDKKDVLEELVKEVPVGTKMTLVRLGIGKSGFLNLEKFEPEVSEEGSPEDIRAESDSSSVFVPLGYCPNCGEKTLTFRNELTRLMNLTKRNCAFCYFNRDVNEEN
jgi:hypothetical protein